MDPLKYVAVLAVAGMVGLGAGVVSAQETKEVGRDLIVRGELTAVDSTATPPTVTLKVLKGKQAESMTIAVPPTAKILEGKTVKALGDLVMGEHVRIKYDRTQDKFEADQIHILKGAKPKTS